MAEAFLRHLAGDRFEDQHPKGLSTYLGKEYFNYLIIVCARAEERCPKTFPGVGTTFSWIFEDPRRDEDLPYDSMLEGFRTVRDQVELRMRGWLEQPEVELEMLRDAVSIGNTLGDQEHDPFRRA
jgi:arsenate reductase